MLFSFVLGTSVKVFLISRSSSSYLKTGPYTLPIPTLLNSL